MIPSDQAYRFIFSIFSIFSLFSSEMNVWFLGSDWVLPIVAIEISKSSITGVEIEHVDISDLPLLNTDLEGKGTFPPVVEAFRQKILEADSILFASPEYNYSVSGIILTYYFIFQFNLHIEKWSFCLSNDRDTIFVHQFSFIK